MLGKSYNVIRNINPHCLRITMKILSKKQFPCEHNEIRRCDKVFYSFEVKNRNNPASKITFINVGNTLQKS